jgi:hypothetical protein
MKTTPLLASSILLREKEKNHLLNNCKFKTNQYNLVKEAWRWKMNNSTNSTVFVRDLLIQFVLLVALGVYALGFMLVLLISVHLFLLYNVTNNSNILIAAIIFLFPFLSLMNMKRGKKSDQHEKITVTLYKKYQKKGWKYLVFQSVTSLIIGIGSFFIEKVPYLEPYLQNFETTSIIFIMIPSLCGLYIITHLLLFVLLKLNNKVSKQKPTLE